MKALNSEEIMSVSGGEGLFYDLGYAYYNFVAGAAADFKDFLEGVADGFESTQTSDGEGSDSNNGG